MSRFWVEKPAWKCRKNMSIFLAKPYGPGLKSRLRKTKRPFPRASKPASQPRTLMYDTELVGPGHKPRRLKSVWEALLSHAALIGGAEKRSSIGSRRDAFTRKRGPMSVRDI